MPDPKLTPGVADPGMTAAKLCAKSFHTSDVRAVSEATKRQAYAEYHRTPSKGVCCEVDHLISLELGGSNDLKNLWPEPYDGCWNARVKDKLENTLHRLVCNGALTLNQAQEAIRTDWISAYKKYVGSDHDQCERR